MIINRNFFTLIGVIVGIVIIFTGLLSKNNDDPNTIVINNNILKSFYLSNRNLEDPVFIKFDNLNNNQILLLKEEFIKKEVLKKEALTWGLDKVDPLILNRLAQLGEQTIVNNFLESDFSNDDLVLFYNRNKYLYIEEAKITFTHIFFRKDKIKQVKSPCFLIKKITHKKLIPTLPVTLEKALQIIFFYFLQAMTGKAQLSHLMAIIY